MPAPGSGIGILLQSGSGSADRDNVEETVPFEDVLVAAQAAAPWACTELWEKWSPRVTGYLLSLIHI